MINPSTTAVAPRPSHRRVLFFMGEVCSRLSNSQSIESSGLSQGANQAQSKVKSPKSRSAPSTLTLDSRLVLLVQCPPRSWVTHGLEHGLVKCVLWINGGECPEWNANRNSSDS